MLILIVFVYVHLYMLGEHLYAVCRPGALV